MGRNVSILKYLKLTQKIRLLICTPKLKGGLSAVVSGIENGLLSFQETVSYKKIPYARSFYFNNPFVRLAVELKQFILFLFVITQFKPNVVLIETSFDKKTIVRDFLHVVVLRVFRIKRVLHVHGGYWDFICSWQWIFRVISKYLLRYVSLVVVTSKEEFEVLRKKFSGVSAVKIDNPVLFSHKTVPQLKGNSPIRVIFASRLAPNKGIMDVIEAAKILKDEPFQFDIYGIGELEPYVKKIIGDENLKVSMFGNVPLDELHKAYLHGDVYLFPSYHMEGFPMSLFFAVAAGLPIIATRVRPLPDFLKSSDNCLWVEEKNPIMVADALRQLGSDNDLRLKMSVANLELIKKFTPTKIVSDLLKSFVQIQG